MSYKQDCGVTLRAAMRGTCCRYKGSHPPSEGFRNSCAASLSTLPVMIRIDSRVRVHSGNSITSNIRQRTDFWSRDRPQACRDRRPRTSQALPLPQTSRTTGKFSCLSLELYRYKHRNLGYLLWSCISDARRMSMLGCEVEIAMCLQQAAAAVCRPRRLALR